MNLPNKLTISRVVMAVLIIIILLGGDYTASLFGFEIPKLFVNEEMVVDLKYIIAGFLFIIASLTDFLDGYIARKYNLITKLGKILDPMADKLLQFSALVGLWVMNIIPFWITLIFFLKEVFMGLGALKLLKNKDVVVPSKWFGKLSTVFFFIAIIFSMLSATFTNLTPYVLPMFILALISLFFAFTMYLVNFIKVTKKDK